MADAALTFWAFDESTQFAAAAMLHLAISVAAALLLYKLQFGKWFRLLLDNGPAPWQPALLLFALEASMEVFLSLGNGIQTQYLRELFHRGTNG